MKTIFPIHTQSSLLSYDYLMVNITAYLMWADRPHPNACEFDKLHQGVVFNPSAPLGHVVSFMESGWGASGILCASNI